MNKTEIYRRLATMTPALIVEVDAMITAGFEVEEIEQNLCVTLEQVNAILSVRIRLHDCVIRIDSYRGKHRGTVWVDGVQTVVSARQRDTLLMADCDALYLYDIVCAQHDEEFCWDDIAFEHERAGNGPDDHHGG